MTLLAIFVTLTVIVLAILLQPLLCVAVNEDTLGPVSSGQGNLHATEETVSDLDQNMKQCHDLLAVLVQDMERGVVSPAQADAACNDIQNLVHAIAATNTRGHVRDKQARGALPTRSVPTNTIDTRSTFAQRYGASQIASDYSVRLGCAALVALLLPLGAFLLYLTFGAPQLASAPPAHFLSKTSMHDVRPESL